MANSWSIILAVVSAKNDHVNQIVTKLTRDVDSKIFGLLTLSSSRILYMWDQRVKKNFWIKQETRTFYFDSIGMASQIEMMTTENARLRIATGKKNVFFRKASGCLYLRNPWE